MTPETAFNLTIVAIGIALVGLIASEIRTNLLRERVKDRERAEQSLTTAEDGAPFADVLNAPSANHDI